MVHDREREGAVADGAHHIGEHRKWQRQRPDFLLNTDVVLGARRSEQTGQEEQRRRYRLMPEIHTRLPQPANVLATMIGPSTVSTTLPTA